MSGTGFTAPSGAAVAPGRNTAVAGA